MKTITKRDLVVIQVVTTLIPNVARITIRKYDSEPNESEHQSARIIVPEIWWSELTLKLKEERDEWIPLWLYVPNNPDEVHRYPFKETGNFYDVFRGPDGVGLRKR